MFKRNIKTLVVWNIFAVTAFRLVGAESHAFPAMDWEVLDVPDREGLCKVFEVGWEEINPPKLTENEIVNEMFQNGYVVYQKKGYEDAQVIFDKVIALDPEHVYSLYYKAACIQNLESYEKALPIYIELLKLDPKNLGGLQQRGNCYRILKRYAEALADLNESIAIKPDCLYSYYIRSLIYFELGDYLKAKKDLEISRPFLLINKHFLYHE